MLFRNAMFRSISAVGRLIHLWLMLFILVSLQCGQENTTPEPEKELQLGADLSYVNEMEDCGVQYRENGVVRDPFNIFADNGCNLVRLRLWHSPSWYDTLNQGRRYSDFQDVRKSIQRARSAGMQVLLDFHLSDTWADPGRQLVPAAWEPVVDNLPVLEDSVYQYVFQTLTSLYNDGLLPEMVQVGNETNREILLSPQANAAGGPINWDRNGPLFNAAISAVREVEKNTGAVIKVALHVADPSKARNLMVGFWTAGVQDFDIIGLSYYWAWHKPVGITQTGSVIADLRAQYPGKDVMIVETACIWTTASNDSANNILNEVHPDYAPASPENQRRWLADLTREVKKRGGLGVIYWEPAWVTSPCRTSWGQGSHQENAAFFDFDTNVLPDGGMGWYGGSY
ncbi:MAG: arabinogalactan endo-1,4-beta-galactosidase [Bacteroidetes bacterium]|nr:MAG: arabinogalactan endo-1,4-beta-galactosidase [Bacteroidota bacterium]